MVNFARRLKVPGYHSWGYNDEVCPPTSTFAAYNIIAAPKQLLIDPQQGHTTIRQQTDPIEAWLLARLGVRK